MEYDGQISQVPVGHFFWIDCEKAQHYRTSERTGNWRVIWVHFTGGNSRYYYEQFLANNNGQNVGALSEDSSLAAEIYALMKLYKDYNGTSDILASSLLTSIMAKCITASQHTDPVTPAYVREAREHILRHYTEDISLETLARQLSLSKFYLQKLFKQHTGQTPNEFLTTIRLNRAKQALQVTDKPVNQIAEEIGIPNVSYFIKLFKHFEGITPLAYRQNWQVKG